jgi:excisionase family DNA binding protein
MVTIIMQDHSPQFMSIAAVSVRLGVPEPTIRTWVLRRILPTVRIGGRRLVDVSALDAMIANCRREALNKP